MEITERARQNLFARLDERLGRAEAETMMELLPHQGWSDVARRGDLENMERSLNDRITAESAVLRAEMAGLRADLNTEMAELRSDLTTEMAGLRAELTSEVSSSHGQVTAELSGLRVEFHTAFGAFRDELHRDQRMLQRQVIVALVVALVSVVLTTVNLG